MRSRKNKTTTKYVITAKIVVTGPPYWPGYVKRVAQSMLGEMVREADPDVTLDGEVHWQEAIVDSVEQHHDQPWSELQRDGYTRHS